MKAEKVVRVLSLLEWSGPGTLKASCPWCWRWQRAGHCGDCGLDALLSEARAEVAMSFLTVEEALADYEAHTGVKVTLEELEQGMERE